MKNILKTAIGTVLGIFIFLFIMAGVGVVLSIILWSSVNRTGQNRNKATVLQIKLTSTIIEKGDESESFLSYPPHLRSIKLKGILKAIEKAKGDENIKGISLELDQVKAGITQLKDIRAVLEDFKNSKKFIYTYGQQYSQEAYYLGSVADSVFLNPSGSIDFKGLSLEQPFYKKLAEKFGVNFTTYRHGKYKSITEPYTQNKMSQESREQSVRLLHDIWGNLITEIGQSRNIVPEKLNQIADELSGTIAELSYQNRLVDQLVYYDEFIKIIQTKLKIKSTEKVPFISLSDYIEHLPEKTSKNNIAILYASGMILQGNGNQEIQDETYKNLITEIKDNPSIQAVVLRINSRGGDALASENIYRELLNLKKEKPLIVSLGDYAASGGYYIAAAGDQILASPISITGSIGVIGLIPDVKKLSEKLGITTDSVTTNANSIPFSPLSSVNSQYKKMMIQNIEKFYSTFISHVAQGRKMSFEQINAIAQGQIWSGKEALEKGLIDRLGNLNDAIKFAAKKAKIQKYAIVEFPKSSLWSETLKNFYKNANIQNQVRQVLGPKYSRLITEFNYLRSPATIYAQSSFKIY
ncbi:MAG: signal peptide peptidase SppA [Flavobacteriales bacterium AspAUS03]